MRCRWCDKVLKRGNSNWKRVTQLCRNCSVIYKKETGLTFQIKNL